MVFVMENKAHSVTLFWFRRDLRLSDNHGLFRALTESGNVLPLFIFDTDILDRLSRPLDPRVEFIHREAGRLKAELERKGSTLLVRHGRPADVFRALAAEYRVRAVYCNRDYEPRARDRDAEIARLCGERGIPFLPFKDQVILEPGEVLKDDGTPYTVYTPYMRRWKKVFTGKGAGQYPSEMHLGEFVRHAPAPEISLADLGFRETGMPFPSREPDEEVIRGYHLHRDFPAREGTSRLGVHFRFGTVSIREWVNRALDWNEKFLDELIWREFYAMILWHFPHAAKGAFRPAYDRIAWRNDGKEFEAWCRGNTGYPLVDAGMRQLNGTGYMHNRVRMIAAGFLVKDLLVDWRWGEAYFAGKLLDFELSSNNGGWQWAAGTGCDAAPWFRVFNPRLQLKKFDPREEYIRAWIPELDTGSYPPPMVDHAAARDRVIAAYRRALPAKD